MSVGMVIALMKLVGVGCSTDSVRDIFYTLPFLLSVLSCDSNQGEEDHLSLPLLDYKCIDQALQSKFLA